VIPCINYYPSTLISSDFIDSQLHFTPTTNSLRPWLSPIIPHIIQSISKSPNNWKKSSLSLLYWKPIHLNQKGTKRGEVALLFRLVKNFWLPLPAPSWPVNVGKARTIPDSIHLHCHHETWNYFDQDIHPTHPNLKSLPSTTAEGTVDGDWKRVLK